MIKKFLVIFIIITCSLILSSQLAIALNKRDSPVLLTQVDTVTDNFKVGEEMYLETCAKCHIAIPPAVLPVETWKKILEKPLDHYGVSVEGMNRLTQVLIWNYVSNYSRNLIKDEIQPEFIAQSRYFKALHPKVELPNPVTHRSCIVCHVNANKFDYRTINN